MLGDAIKIPELKKRLLFTLGMLVIYRLGVFVPTPGIDAAKLRNLFESASSTLFGMVNMFSGGALENFSVFALGIMPYISVSIIIQLLTTAIPTLEELSKEGEQGKRVITRYTRYGTIALAMVQGFFISMGLESQGVVSDPGFGFRITTAVTLTAGTAFIMWLGEQITERGIGNGISIIIFAGIVARMPSTLGHTFDLMSTGEIHPLTVLSIILMGIATVGVIVFVERCQRQIPVQYPRRSVGGGRVTQATSQFLPLKLNTAGVIPAIFASTFLALPITFAQFSKNEAVQDVLRFFAPPNITYELLYAALIVFFSYFYTAIIFDPKKMAENLKQNGGFVPAVRPGKETAQFLSSVLSRLTLWGAVYVSLICIIPSVFYREMGAAAFSAFFGGTAALIVVGVMMDTVAQIQSHMMQSNYDSFMKKGMGKVRGANKGINIRGQLIKR